MLDTLKFVQGAVSKKEYVPELSHFRIAGGRIVGYNGHLCISSPIALDIDCCPKATQLVRAIAACEEEVQIALTPKGRLSVVSGAFRGHVDTVPLEVFPDVQPEGELVQVDGELLPALRVLMDYTSEDASRPWASGVLLDGASAFATNNVVLVERWLGYHFPYRVNLPSYAVREMLRIREEPKALRLSSNSLTVYYDGDRWMRTQLNSAEWPDARALLDRSAQVQTQDVPEGLWRALETVAPMLGELKAVYVQAGSVATGEDEDCAARVVLESLPADLHGAFNCPMLQSLEGIAQRIALETWPQPCPFYGDKLRGLLVGLKPVGAKHA